MKQIDEWSRKNCKNARPITRANGSKGFIRCYSRDPRKCFFCAAQNRQEMKIIIGSGCHPNERYGITEEMLEGFGFYWDTLTAPSFGKTHVVPKSRDSKVRQCPCGDVHSFDSGMKGVPLGRYDRHAAVEWNMKSSSLITQSFKRLKLWLPGVEFVIVREFQARGALHIHYLVRADENLYDEATVLEAMNKIRRTESQGIKWGKESAGAERLTRNGTADSVRYMSKVVGYTAKAQGLYDKVSPERMKHYDLLAKHAEKIKHNKKCVPETCRSTAHRNIGFQGHMATMSEGWSLVGLNRKVLAQARREWVEENIHNKQSAGDLEEDSLKFKQLASLPTTRIAC